MPLLRILILAACCVLMPGLARAQASDNQTDSSRLFRMKSGEVLKQYYFVMLKKGAQSEKIKDTATINALQRGHMANMERMAGLGKLVVAGPFGDDGNWRGIFVFDCNSEDEVKKLLATDPSIAAGRLDYEIHPWWTQRGATFK